MRGPIIAAVALGLAAAAPGSAQQWSGIRTAAGGPAAGSGVPRELGRLDRAIDAGSRSGQLSHRKARQLRRENRTIGTLQDRFAQGGLSPGERWEFDGRARAEADRVAAARLAGGK